MESAQHYSLQAEVMKDVEERLAGHQQFAPGAPGGVVAGGVADFVRSHAPQLISALLAVADAAAGPLGRGDREGVKKAVADQTIASLIGLLGSLQGAGAPPAA